CGLAFNASPNLCTNVTAPHCEEERRPNNCLARRRNWPNSTRMKTFNTSLKRAAYKNNTEAMRRKLTAESTRQPNPSRLVAATGRARYYNGVAVRIARQSGAPRLQDQARRRGGNDRFARSRGGN